MKRVISVATIYWSALQRFNTDDGSAMAGFIAFSALLSLFPFLIFATTVIGIGVGVEESDSIVDALFNIAPPNVAMTLEPVVHEVLNNKSGEILTLSALFAIWVASNAVEAIRVAFDRAYGVHEPHHFIINRAKAIGIVFMGAVVAALLGFSILLSPLMLSLAQGFAGIQIPFVAAYMTYGFGITVFLGFVYILHRTLPGRPMKNMHIWPGVFVTTLFWVIAATGFSVYLRYTPTYTVTYGTLAGVIITLMFFYITGATILFGAEYNAALSRLEKRAKAAEGET